MNRPGSDRTAPPESETRRRPGACTHLDMAGDSAIEIFPSFTMCSICGDRWEANGARIHLEKPAAPADPVVLERILRKLDP
jgi:hypothetical protein